MFLIFPPAAKPCEPPAGIAKLAATLSAHDIPCILLDANLEGMLYLAQQPRSASDTWTRRAAKNISANLTALRNHDTYRSPDRYNRAVMDVNRVLEASAKEYGAVLGLADYHHQALSPVRSTDLLFAAEHPEQNPFYPWFSKRLPEVMEYNKNPPQSPFFKGGRECAEISPPFSKGRQGGFAGNNGPANIVGFSLNYLSQALCAFAMIGYLKREFRGVNIVLGGGLVTSWMRRPGWQDPFNGFVDHLIAGPGEGALLDLHGIYGARKRHVAPDYHALSHDDYLSPGFILPYSVSSGCYWNKCSFCPEPAEQNPYIPTPPEQALCDLGTLIENTKPMLVHLLDNAVSPALMTGIAEKQFNVPWYGFARIGKELLDREFCRALRRSGCVMLKLGLESGDQDVLDRMQKGIDLGTASQVLNNLRETGIATYVYLLFGAPAETEKAARKTLAFVERHAEAITFLNLAVFNMPVCGKEAGEYATTQFYEGDLSLYTGFTHPHGWDRKTVRLFLDREFKKNAAVAAILKRDPPLFTSNHAAFFAGQQ